MSFTVAAILTTAFSQCSPTQAIAVVAIVTYSIRRSSTLPLHRSPSSHHLICEVPLIIKVSRHPF